MKKLIIILVVLLSTMATSAQLDTTIANYDFNNLIPGNLHGTDSWVTTLTGTIVDVQVAAGYSHDSSNAAHFTQSGGNVNASGNRPLDSIFPNFNYADSGLYYLYFDIRREYWGSEFGLAYDQNHDGFINQAGNTEKGLRFKTAQNGGCWLYAPNGTTNTSPLLINSGWNRIEIKLDVGANNGLGFVSVRFKAIGGSSWTNIFTNVSAGLDSTSTGAKNPANWDHVFFHFTGTESGLDNIQFWRIVPLSTQPNQSPTDIGLSPDTISENQPPHTFVGILTTVDPDVNDSHQYSFTNGAGDADNADFLISNDSLFSSVSFDYENSALKYIRIKTEDQAGAFFEKAFVINIIDVVEINPGIEEFTEHHLHIYPNPTQEKLLIEVDEGMQPRSVRLFTINGFLIKEKKPQAPNFLLDVSNLSNGQYILVVEYANGVSHSRKILILH